MRATRADFTARRARPAPRSARPQARAGRARATIYGRRRGAAAEGAISGEELAHAADAGEGRRAPTCALARSQQAQSRNAVQGTDVGTNPRCSPRSPPIAAPRSRAATCTSPRRSTASSRSARCRSASRSPPGTPLMAVVPLDRRVGRRQFPRDAAEGPAHRPAGDGHRRHLWRRHRLSRPRRRAGRGQSATPSRCCRRRTPAATGSRSSSACRCASRSIRASCARNPLRVGLSVTATVDTADTARRAPRPARAARLPRPSPPTRRDPAVEARIRQIIAANR